MKRALTVEHLARVIAALCLFAAVEANGQAPVRSVSTEQPQSQSRDLGAPVTHPEELSGVWEAPNGHGGAIGIHLGLMTTAPAEATTLIETPQSWLRFGVGVYERADAVLQFGEANYFSDDMQPPGGVRYDAGRLTLHYPEVDLDLVRIERGNWQGRFHRKQFDSIVTLTRPQPLHTTDQPWFLGTWRTGDAVHQDCLHIVETSPGAFTGWSDSLTVWGSARFAPHLKRPEYSLEHYGDLAKVQARENDRVSVELAAYTAICCSHGFTGTPAANGTIMQADWPAGPNQAPHTSEWKKMPGDSCIAPSR
jgi:hypothetical protein